MLPEILPEAKLKLSKDAGGDYVIVINNLPKKFLYRKGYVPEVIKDERGIGTEYTKPSAIERDELLPKLKEDQTGRGFVLFELRNSEVSQVYAAIMNFVERSLPRGELIPTPVKYSSDPEHPSASPIDDAQIPRVMLPVSSPPSAKAVEAGTPSTLPPTDKRKTRVLSEEEKERRRENMAKARAAKK